jgi:hypothetical protein
MTYLLINPHPTEIREIKMQPGLIAGKVNWVPKSINIEKNKLMNTRTPLTLLNTANTADYSFLARESPP